MSGVEDLLALLPVHVRAQDEASGGLLRALLEAVAGELDVLERDLDDLYQDWFVETAAAWALPYLGDLLGIDDLPGGVGRRAVVAHTIDYRRRKGTPAVVEQVARDVTAWPARAVELYRLLATTAHLNHVRLDRPALADVRRAADLGSPRVARGSLDPAMHTAEVRRIGSGRGRYGITGVGVFLFPHQVYEVVRAPARARGAVWSVHPLGMPTPLFTPATHEATVEHLAQEADLPVPLRPRRLLALLGAARAGLLPAEALPIGVTLTGPDLVGESEISPERLRVCGLEDLARMPDVREADGTVREGEVLAGWQVVVDARDGTLGAYRDGVREPADSGAVTMHVRYSYGGTADVGAGTYDRADVHEQVLAADPYVRSVPVEVVAQHVVRLDTPAPVTTDPVGPTLGDVLATVEGEWRPPHLPGVPEPTTGSTTVVCVGDSGSWSGDLAVTVPARTRLVLVAATWTGRVLGDGLPVPGEYAPVGLRPHVRGTLTVTGGAGSSLVVDGLVIEGDVVVTAGDLGSLALSQTTVTGRLWVRSGTANGNRALQVRLVRAEVGHVVIGAAVPRVEVVDSVLSPEVGAPTEDRGTVLRAPGAHLAVSGSTLRGAVEVRTLAASDCVLDGVVTVAHRQTGFVRYSHVEPGSRVPRRFRCVPAEDVPDAPRPVYVSRRKGSPSFLALAHASPIGIREGAEGGDEMGAHFHAHRPTAVRAARRLIEGYVPMGLEVGMVRDG